MLVLNLQFFGGRGSEATRAVGLTQGEKIEAAEAYIGPEGFEMNKLLRGQAVDEEMYSRADIERYTRNFEKVLDEAGLKSAKTVFRGTGYNALESFGFSREELLKNPKLLVGKEYSDKAFLSTANDYQTAKDYSQGVVWKISLPKGAKAIRENDFSQDGGPEYTVHNNAELKITRAQVSNGTLIINAKYTGVKRKRK